MDILGQLFLGLFAVLGLLAGWTVLGFSAVGASCLLFYRFLLRLGGGQGFLLDLLGVLPCSAARRKSAASCSRVCFVMTIP